MMQYFIGSHHVTVVQFISSFGALCALLMAWAVLFLMILTIVLEGWLVALQFHMQCRRRTAWWLRGRLVFVIPRACAQLVWELFAPQFLTTITMQDSLNIMKWLVARSPLMITVVMYSSIAMCKCSGADWRLDLCKFIFVESFGMALALRL